MNVIDMNARDVTAGNAESKQAGSRQRMLEAAIMLMRGSGLSGAGINEIVRASGAPKGSVYHYFPQGKSQLVSEALLAYSGRVEAFIDTAVAGRRSPAGKLRALFGAFAARVEASDFRQSCAGGTVCLDLAEGLDALQPVIAGMFARWIERLASHFDFGGDYRRAHAFAGLLLTTIEGAYIRCRAERSSQPFTEAAECLAALLND